LVLVVSPQHPLAGRKHIQMVELHRCALALSSTRYVTRKILDDCFRACGAEPIIAAEINSTSVLLRLVACTEMATIISRYAVMDRTDLRIVHLENPTPTRTPGILWQSRDQPQFVHSFVAYVRDVALDAAMSLRSNPKRESDSPVDSIVKKAPRQRRTKS
jgi:LysR family cyn operon transcriptional activator